MASDDTSDKPRNFGTKDLLLVLLALVALGLVALAIAGTRTVRVSGESAGNSKPGQDRVVPIKSGEPK